MKQKLFTLIAFILFEPIEPGNEISQIFQYQYVSIET